MIIQDHIQASHGIITVIFILFTGNNVNVAGYLLYCIDKRGRYYILTKIQCKYQQVIYKVVMKYLEKYMNYLRI